MYWKSHFRRENETGSRGKKNLREIHMNYGWGAYNIMDAQEHVIFLR